MYYIKYLKALNFENFDFFEGGNLLFLNFVFLKSSKFSAFYNLRFLLNVAVRFLTFFKMISNCLRFQLNRVCEVRLGQHVRLIDKGCQMKVLG